VLLTVECGNKGRWLRELNSHVSWIDILNKIEQMHAVRCHF
jgi:hypothetical protein